MSSWTRVFSIAAALGLLGAVPAAAALRIDTTSRVDGQPFTDRQGVYDYVPSVYFDGQWRLFWCGSGVAGDFIYQRTASVPQGPWSPLRVSLAPNYTPGTFDGQHTCDPSVIRIGGTSYLYYGGFPVTPNSVWPPTTQIGVATSTDGVNWFRQNGGRPIISPQDLVRASGRYGAGQPSAIYVAPYVYLLYHDSSGAVSNALGGSYIIRSTDPLFRGAVEELSYDSQGALRFIRRESVQRLATNYHVYAPYGLASADWMYSDELRAFIIAFHGVQRQTNLLVFDQSLSSPNPIAHLAVPLPAPWIDGPGLVRRSDGHALPHGTGSTSRVPIILFYATGSATDSRTWDLRYAGVDLVRF